MSRAFAITLVAVVLASLPVALRAQAPPDVVATIAVEAEKGSRVMDHLDHLTNEIGPRLTGSERLNKACEWARDQFKSFGIENARIEQWGTVDVGFDRGKSTGFLVAGSDRTPLTFGTDAWTPGTDGVREGKAVLGPVDDAGLNDLRANAKGAWVVRAPRSRGVKAVLDLCVEVGALGYVTSAADGAGFAGDLAPQLILTGGNHQTKWDKLPKLVRINLFDADYKTVLAKLEKGEDFELAFDVQNRFKQGPVPVYNVIADIPGTEKPDEMVIVGGHIDSWDGATGTTDNGTGVATTLEAARLLMKAGAKPRRTIRFMLWSGEEQGLLGSKAWIRNHPDELEKISAVLVHDGGTNYVSGISAMPEMVPAMKTAFKPVFDLLGETMEEAVPESRPESRSESRPAGRRSRESLGDDKSEALKFQVRRVANMPYPIGSDHDSFLARGVPGFFWRQAGRANYTYTHHTQHDTFDAAIPEYQRHSSKVIALGALGVANLDEMLPRPKEMIRSGGGFQPRRRLLGIQIKDDEDLTIDSFSEESRAEKAGLKAGDKIVKIDGLKVSNRTELSDALSGGERKKIVVMRDKAEIEVTIEFPPAESRPDSRRRGDR